MAVISSLVCSDWLRIVVIGNEDGAVSVSFACCFMGHSWASSGLLTGILKKNPYSFRAVYRFWDAIDCIIFGAFATFIGM